MSGRYPMSSEVVRAVMIAMFFALALLVSNIVLRVESSERPRVGEPSPEIEKTPVTTFENRVMTPYEIGYQNGTDAFQKQFGLYRPSERSYSAYAQMHGPQAAELSDEDGEEISRGYVDGYHRASELMVCPRGSEGR